jgi:hypothetical protein
MLPVLRSLSAGCMIEVLALMRREIAGFLERDRRSEVIVVWSTSCRDGDGRDPYRDTLREL